MAFIIALALVVGFTTNVVIGAVQGTAPLGVVSEMLVLFAAAVAFTVGILQREARAGAQAVDDSAPPTE